MQIFWGKKCKNPSALFSKIEFLNVQYAYDL